VIDERRVAFDDVRPQTQSAAVPRRRTQHMYGLPELVLRNCDERIDFVRDDVLHDVPDDEEHRP
jgi:hypothetical protein